MEKKNTGMKVAIVILSILVVGLLGYVLYDKVLNTDDIFVNDNNYNQNNNDNNSDKTSSNNTINFLEQIEGVWGYSNYILSFRKDNNEYFYDQGEMGTDAGVLGIIKKITEPTKSEYKLEVFVEGCKSNECEEITDDETIFITIKYDSVKNIIINNGNEYPFITKDFSNEEIIRDFFY